MSPEVIPAGCRQSTHNGTTLSTMVTPSRLAQDADSDRPEKDPREELENMADLLALVAHELRNPLHAMALQMSVARHTAEGHGQADTSARLAKAQKTLERYTDRVTVLLDLVTRQSRAYPVNLQSLDLSAVLSGVVESLLAEAAYFGVELRHKNEGPCPALTDALLIEQIVENLVLNAFKHASCKVVTVSLRSADGWADLAVADNGRGIAKEDQDRIFHKFGVSRASGRGSGSGLGLWIVRRLVQVLGGTVSLVSAPGQGCTFTVRFPLFPTAQPTTS